MRAGEVEGRGEMLCGALVVVEEGVGWGKEGTVETDQVRNLYGEVEGKTWQR